MTGTQTTGTQTTGTRMTTTLPPAIDTAPPVAPVGGPVLGAPLDRRDGPAKTSGQARYSTEFPLPNLVHAALVHADVARARILSIDPSRATAQPGVLRVLTRLNAPVLKPTQPPSVLRGLATMAPGTMVNYLNTDQVYFDGQPVAVVVADTLETAQYAAGLVEVAYEPLPAGTDFAVEQHRATPTRGMPGLPGAPASRGDAAAALAVAPFTVDNTFTTPAHSHNALEPHATTAAWDGDRLTVHEGNQNIDWMRQHLAAKFDVPAAGVRVISTFTGGGFGGRVNVWAGTVLAVLAARVVGRPVRLMLTREGVYRTVGGRTPSWQRLALGATADGRLTALIHTSITRTGRVGGGPEQVTSCSTDLYAAENITADPRQVAMDLVPNTSMRAPGESIGTFALESSIDELAGELGMDPIELRLRNQPQRHPINSRRRLSHHGVGAALRRGAELFGWRDRDPRPGSMRAGRELVGWGVAAAIHPAWQFPANLTVRLDADGGLLVRCGFQEMGMGTATAVAQLAAHALGVAVERVRVEYGDTVLPTAPGAGGSAQTASIADAVVRAADALRAALLRLERRQPDSPLRGARRAATRLRDGGLYGPAGGRGLGDILRRAGRAELTVQVGADAGLGAVAGQVRGMGKLLLDGQRWAKAASGAQLCEVRVDADTGEVRVSRWVGVFDIGTVVNAKLAASQLRGGIVMGLGLALAEATLIDPRTGRIMNPSLAEYHVPVHADVPPIVIECLDQPDPTMPMGVLGAGEVGITGVAAAVANAIHHATGRRIRDLPITLDAVVS